jgi:hypothetical protein
VQIAEILFEVAVLDPVLEECIVERVVDEDVPKCAQEAINELSQAGLKRLETDVHHDFGRWLIDSFAADYVLGFFGLQGQTRFDSEGIDRALNSVLFDELFIAMLDIDRSHRGTLQNEANKFAYDKVFTGLVSLQRGREIWCVYLNSTCFSSCFCRRSKRCWTD